MPTGFQKFLLLSTVLSALYVLALVDVLPLPFLASSAKDAILPVVRLPPGIISALRSQADVFEGWWADEQLPWWALVTFGSYSLGSIGWGLWTFRECPEAHRELLEEIDQAKNELWDKGVSVD